jgi:hypothetical protein
LARVGLEDRKTGRGKKTHGVFLEASFGGEREADVRWVHRISFSKLFWWSRIPSLPPPNSARKALIVIQNNITKFGGGAASAAVGVEEVTKIPDTRPGIDEAKCAVLLLFFRYAHRDLPTMRGLAMMMVMSICVQVFHVVRYCMG